MTAETVDNCITRAVQKVCGAPPEVAARTAMYARVLLDMELEREEGAAGTEASRLKSPPPTVGDSGPVLPPSPSIQPGSPAPARPQPSLLHIPVREVIEQFDRTGKLPPAEDPNDIVLTVSDDEAERVEAEAKREVIEQGGHGEPIPKYWDAARLVHLIQTNTPPTLEIIPKGQEGRIKLGRKIQNVSALYAVKLSYEHSMIASGSTTSKNVSIPVALGLVVSVDFFVTDRKIRISEAMRKLVSDAETQFGVRSKDIVSRTPVRHGPMNFDGSEPHVTYEMMLEKS